MDEPLRSQATRLTRRRTRHAEHDLHATVAGDWANNWQAGSLPHDDGQECPSYGTLLAKSGVDMSPSYQSLATYPLIISATRKHPPRQQENDSPRCRQGARKLRSTLARTSGWFGLDSTQWRKLPACVVPKDASWKLTPLNPRPKPKRPRDGK